MRVLIVDDDFIARRVLKDILSFYGHCDLAADGLQAVQAFRSAWAGHRPYDLICMDIIMPKMDGLESLIKIRKLEKLLNISKLEQVKIIIITALNDPKNIIDSYFKVGASSYLIKPINSQRIHEEVNNLGLPCAEFMANV